MEQRFDLDLWQSAARSGKQADGASRTMEWAGLAARLAAGHAYQRELALCQTAWAAPAGSFDPAAARQLIDFAAAAPTDWGFDMHPVSSPQSGAYAGINPIVLGDRKGMSGKHSGIAGLSLPAVEG
jgi:hypothetical protein